jgi:hypothetical protein
MWAWVATGTIRPLTCTEVRRNVSSPGACRRPLGLAEVTLPRAGAPVRTRVLPLTTSGRASVASNLSPALAVAELISDPTRTVSLVPAGMVLRLRGQRCQQQQRSNLERSPQHESSLQDRDPWRYYAVTR